MVVELVSYTPDPVNVIGKAASTCYDSDQSSVGKLMIQCYNSGHQSVLEHASFTFKISGVSRALMAQLTRHRIGTAFSIRSQRYCKESEFQYVTPKSITNDKISMDFYQLFMRDTQHLYNSLVKRGIPPEDARYVLPNACCTEISFTVNLRELIHICNERLCARAQWEIRDLVGKMKEEVCKIMPEAEDMLVPKCEMDSDMNYCREHVSCGRYPKLDNKRREVK